MGILNINADSFYDGGQYDNVEAALAHCGEMLEEGAQLIDIGAASSKPGSALIEADAEWKILEPVLSALKDAYPAAHFSIDTYHSQVAEKSIMAGAQMINDISGGRFDERMAEVIGDLKVPYVIMHMQGTPATMQDNPHYENITREVAYFFSEQIEKFNACGATNLLLDPGFGFGKNLDHNYELFNNLGLFKKIFNLPVMVGVSRKSMINQVLKTSPDRALNGSSALHTLALEQGADILRVHDVGKAAEVCAITTYSQKMT